MALEKRLFRRRSLLAAASAVGVSAFLPGCSGIDTAEWTEEVKLHDGQMVTLWRRARRHSSGFPNARRGSYVDLELRYDPLKLYWKGLTSRFQPVAFEVFDGVPYLVLDNSSTEGCTRSISSTFHIQVVRWQAGEWVGVPQSTIPLDVAKRNLYSSFFGNDSDSDAKGLITWATKMSHYDYEKSVAKHYTTRGDTCVHWRRNNNIEPSI